MAKIPEFNPIEFLVRRKFGAAAFNWAMLPSLKPAPGSDPELIREILAYRDHLRQLSPDELQALVSAEIRTQQQEAAAKAELEEKLRFFNQPPAAADFDHWSRCAHWTLDEAIALSFGKAPERVNWKSVEPFANVSPFAIAYQRRRDLALRAVVWGQLFDPVLPGLFLAWAKRTELDVSAELEPAVAARGLQIADWKKLYDAQQGAFEQLQTRFVELQRADAEKGAIIETLSGELRELKASGGVCASGHVVAPADVGTRARESLLKLIIGMAVKGYAYDPEAARTEGPAEIAHDLALVGVPLDVDTVRKWLNQGAELLPPKAGKPG